MKRQYARRFLSVLFLTLLVDGSCAVCLAEGLTLSLPRHAYFRGESIPVAVSTPWKMEHAKIEVFLDGNRVTSTDFTEFEGKYAKVSAPTANVKVGGKLKCVVTQQDRRDSRLLPGSRWPAPRRPAGGLALGYRSGRFRILLRPRLHHRRRTGLGLLARP